MVSSYVSVASFLANRRKAQKWISDATAKLQKAMEVMNTAESNGSVEYRTDG